jgi:O-antigen/teichoic acid export membrane protein
LYNIVIGKLFSASSLGFYTRADHLGNFPSQNVSGILSRVTYPILSQLQDDNDRLNLIYTKYLQLSCFVIFPLMMGLAALAEPLIVLMLGDKWLPSVVLLQILCFGLMLDPICNINLNLLYVKGRSDLVLKLEVIKKAIAVSILIASIPFGLVGLCIGRSCYGIAATLLNMIYTKKFLNLSIWGQVKLILPSLLLSLFMAIAVYAITYMPINNFLKLGFGVVCGIAVYFMLAKFFKLGAFSMLINFIKKNILKRDSVVR